MSYSRRFRHPDHRIVALTRALVRTRPWTLDPGVQLELAQHWVIVASRIYRMPVEPEVVRDALPRYAFFGGYQRETNRIVLEEGRPFSIITLLHEYRHALQAHLGVAPNGSELDARCWSLSVFRKAAPRRFRRMVEAGRIAYATVESEFGESPTQYPDVISPALERELIATFRAESSARLPNTTDGILRGVSS